MGIKIKPVQENSLHKQMCEDYNGMLDGHEFIGKCRDSLDKFETIAIARSFLAGEVEIAILAVRKVRLV